MVVFVASHQDAELGPGELLRVEAGAESRREGRRSEQAARRRRRQAERRCALKEIAAIDAASGRQCSELVGLFHDPSRWFDSADAGRSAFYFLASRTLLPS